MTRWLAAALKGSNATELKELTELAPSLAGRDWAARKGSHAAELTELTGSTPSLDGRDWERHGEEALSNDEVVTVNSVNSGDRRAFRAFRDVPQSIPGDAFRHGQDMNGHPRTWTGQIVSLEAWQGLSDWERHGSTGKVWNGLTRAWEAVQGAK